MEAKNPMFCRLVAGVAVILGGYLGFLPQSYALRSTALE